MDIHANLSTEEYSIVEEETADSTKSELGRSKHPSTGFPAIQSRRGPRERSGKQGPGSTGKQESSAREERETSAPLTFSFSQNDILKLRWTSPLGEDEEDWKGRGSSDTNLHNLRFDFDGLLCDNSDPEEKRRQDDLYFYKGLHHHSDEGEFEGYTIPELMHLSRSSNVSQRCIAIRTLGNIFVKIREYRSFNHQSGKPYHEYLLGYLFGIHRWYRYLTGDLSIHYLLLNMLFHESHASRTAEHSVISLNSLLTGGQFPITPLDAAASGSGLFSYFLTPSELIFELMDERLAYYPSYFRNNIISQRLEFFSEHLRERPGGVRYNDLQEDAHLIRFDLPDGRNLELLRDVMQEAFKYIPAKYSAAEAPAQRNYLFVFLCKMAQNKGAILESRISSISLVRLFIQRECVHDQSICLETLQGMLVAVGDEIFDYASVELASGEYSNHSMAKLLFSFVSLVSAYLQSLYNAGGGAAEGGTCVQKRFLGDFLIKSVLQTLRIVVLAVLGPGELRSSGISECIQLALAEGTRIIGGMVLRDIYLEDLSIYCKDIVHYFSAFDLSDSGQAFVGYHLFTLGCSLLFFSQNHEIEYEHLQYIQVLSQIAGKVLRKALVAGEDFSLREKRNFNALLLSVSVLRFQVLMAERPGSGSAFEALEPCLELVEFCEKYLETHSRQSFDLDLLTLESGFLLETEMGMTSIQSILTNQVYGEFCSVILVSTFLKELSQLCLLAGRGEDGLSSRAVQSLKPSIDLLSEMYLRCSRCYCLPNSSRTGGDSDFYSQPDRLFRYDLCYFEALNMNDDQSVSLSSNTLKKSSIYLQALNSNIFYLHLFVYTGAERPKPTRDAASGKPSAASISPFAPRYHRLVSEIEGCNCDLEIPYEKLLTLLFASKNLEEYALALFWILKLEKQAPTSACSFYGKVLSEYSPHLDALGLLMLNPFLYSVNIVYSQVSDGAEALGPPDDPFLLSVMRKVLGARFTSTANSKLTNDFVGFLSRYIFECSVSQIVNISRRKAEEGPLNLELVGKVSLDYLRLSLELQAKLPARRQGPLGAGQSFRHSLIEMICSRGGQGEPLVGNVTMYDLCNKHDNESLRKLADLLVSTFCDSDMYFSPQLSDCLYFLLSFILIEAIPDSDIVMKVLSNIKLVKFLLHNGSLVDISCILERSAAGSAESSEISRDGEVVSLVTEILAVCKDPVCHNTLSVFLVLYLSYFSGSKQELTVNIRKLYEETGTEYLKRVLDQLNKS